MLRLIIIIVVAYFLYGYFLGEESGCEKYASKFSCTYVEEKATYEVFYWLRLQENNPANEQFVGLAEGLSGCRNMAISYSIAMKEQWNERAYICALLKDGRRLEKHRL